MHIVFILPGHGAKPIGGHKIVYQYANSFIKQGFNVSIVYSASGLFSKDKFKHKLISIVRYIYYKSTSKYTPYKWFDLNKKIKLYFNWDIKESNMPDADKYICTSIETAYNLSQIKANKDRFYFIQDLENWKWGDKMLLESWKFNLKKIAISEWLVNKIKSVGERVVLVENGFDFNIFNLDIPINQKQSNTVMMLYHTAPHKGVKNGFEALEIAKEKIPNLKVILFGTFPEPKNLPNWYEYHKSPSKEDLRKLYNKAGIFLGTSIEEGWGLTVGESMQCGCAIVCTDNKGYKAMSINNKTALVSPSGNNKILAENIIKLIEDNELREMIAFNGNLHIRKFNIESAFEKFKNTILNYD